MPHICFVDCTITAFLQRLLDKTIIRQCTRLVLGQGIEYKGWPEGVCFCKDQKIDMSTDLEALHQLAIQYENDYGEDRGHGKFYFFRKDGSITLVGMADLRCLDVVDIAGWLVKIPLRKLMAYQRIYFHRLLGGSDEPTKPVEQVYPIGTKIRKHFPLHHGFFVGEVTFFDGQRYHISYEDGDFETMDAAEVGEWQMLTEAPTGMEREEENPEPNEVIDVDDTTPPAETEEPREQLWPVGTKFLKVFEEHGAFVGEIVSFDGNFYRAVYSDGDQEDLDENEMRRLTILPPSETTAPVP